MGLSETLGFLAIVALATYVQTVWGFALGLTIVGCVALLDLAPISLTAAVVSILSCINALWAVRSSMDAIRWRTVGMATCAQAPGVIGGLALLYVLSEKSMDATHTLLGVCIVASGVLLIARPKPRERVSGSADTVITGIVSGLISGLFSSGGPVWGYYMYRQPLAFADIRATLLMIVAAATGLRILFLGISGGMTTAIAGYTLLSIPVVLLSSLVSYKLRPNLSDQNMRRGAFGILALMGLFLLLR